MLVLEGHVVSPVPPAATAVLPATYSGHEGRWVGEIAIVEGVYLMEVEIYSGKAHVTLHSRRSVWSEDQPAKP